MQIHCFATNKILFDIDNDAIILKAIQQYSKRHLETHNEILLLIRKQIALNILYNLSEYAEKFISLGKR